jgi:hypothetical protein
VAVVVVVSLVCVVRCFVGGSGLMGSCVSCVPCLDACRSLQRVHTCVCVVLVLLSVSVRTFACINFSMQVCMPPPLFSFSLVVSGCHLLCHSLHTPVPTHKHTNTHIDANNSLAQRRSLSHRCHITPTDYLSTALEAARHNTMAEVWSQAEVVVFRPPELFPVIAAARAGFRGWFRRQEALET